MTQKITIFKVRRGSEQDINKELQWVGNSLGLFGLRDKDSSCFRIFITLVRKARNNQAVTSDEIAARLNLSRGTVVHHLNRLRDCGLIVREREGYLLRERDLFSVVKDMQKDMETIFLELSAVAKEIDERLS